MPLENQLLKWYLINKRDLPWRKNKDPYSVWISEIILQQTRVSQGIEYYKNFMKSFPNIEKLSTSKESHVLKVWQGLGYYNRAINLHKTSKEIINNFDGKFPSTYRDLIKFKGIGDEREFATIWFKRNLGKLWRGRTMQYLFYFS